MGEFYAIEASAEVVLAKNYAAAYEHATGESFPDPTTERTSADLVYGEGASDLEGETEIRIVGWDGANLDLLTKQGHVEYCDENSHGIVWTVDSEAFDGGEGDE